MVIKYWKTMEKYGRAAESRSRMFQAKSLEQDYKGSQYGKKKAHWLTKTTFKKSSFKNETDELTYLHALY